MRYCITLSCLCLGVATLNALPHGGRVVLGTGAINQLDEKRLEIKAGDKSHVQWAGFSIGQNELVRFVQPGKGSVVLNQVMGGNPSEIFGTLEANGKVYLINPNGILIGKEGVINVASFVASTLDVLKGNPLENEDLLFSGKGKIVHLGKVTAWDGDVVFLSASMQVEGEIAAQQGRIDLGVGREILLTHEGEERLFVRLPSESQDAAAIDLGGDLSALKVEIKAQGNPLALAIRHRGRIDALQTEERGGRVFLVADGGKGEFSGEIVAPGGEVRILGDEVGVKGSALIDVSGKTGGGKVLIGGDFQGSNPEVINARRTVVENGARIVGDALEKGDGGRLFIWSQEATAFYGLASVRGGKEGGDGGVVALLGDHFFDFRGSADRLAPKGRAGTLILDPTNITICDQDDANVPQLAPFHPLALTKASILSKHTLLAALDEGDVIVQSAGGKGNEAGDVIVATPLLYNSDCALTLRSFVPGVFAGDVKIESPIENSGSGALILDSARDIAISAPITMPSVEGITLTAGRDVHFDHPVSAGGNVTLNAQGEVDVNAPLKSTGGLSIASKGKVDLLASISAGGSGVTVSSGKEVLVRAPIESLGSGGARLSGGGTVDIGSSSLICAPGGVSVVSTQGDILMNGSALVAEHSPITLNATDTGHHIRLADGVRIENGTGSLSLWSGGVIDVSGASTLSTGSGNLRMRARNGISLSGEGSRLASEGGNISLTAHELWVGEGCAVENGSKGITITVENLTLQGEEKGGHIHSSFGKVNINTTGNLTLLGESAISSERGDIVFNNIGGNLLLQDRGQISARGGDIAFYLTQGDVVLSGSSKIISSHGMITFPEEGISGGLLLNGSGVEIASKRDLSISADYLSMNGGSIESREGDLTMHFRRADLGIDENHVAAPQGDLFVKTKEAFHMSGGELLAGKEITVRSLGTLDVIADRRDAMIASAFGNVELNASSDMTFQGSETALALLRNYSGDSITVVTSKDLSIGKNALFENTGWGELNAFADGDLSMTENARFSHYGRGVLATAAGRDMLLSQDAHIDHFGSGNLFIVSGRHTTLLDHFAATTQAGKLTLVVDHFLPGHPIIGDGSFTKGAGVTLSSSSGSVAIYTARRPQNQINGEINGGLFVAGDEYIDSDSERWFTYFHEDVKTALDFFWVYAQEQSLPIFLTAAGSDSKAPPFVIYYKDGRGAVVRQQTPIVTSSPQWKSAVSKANRIARAESEALQDFRVLSDFIFVAKRFLVGYEGTTLDTSDLFYNPLSSFDLMLDDYETILLRQYRTYHTKKLLGWEEDARRTQM